MIRMNIKHLAADTCGVIVAMINNRKMVMTRARVLQDGSWSILVVDATNPNDCSPDAMASLQERIKQLALIFGATIETRVLEDMNGTLHCSNCISIMQPVNSIIDGYYCDTCNNAVYVAGADKVVC